jgi:hypothetical protein
MERRGFPWDWTARDRGSRSRLKTADPDAQKTLRPFLQFPNVGASREPIGQLVTKSSGLGLKSGDLAAGHTIKRYHAPTPMRGFPRGTPNPIGGSINVGSRGWRLSPGSLHWLPVSALMLRGNRSDTLGRVSLCADALILVEKRWPTLLPKLKGQTRQPHRRQAARSKPTEADAPP